MEMPSAARMRVLSLRVKALSDAELQLLVQDWPESLEVCPHCQICVGHDNECQACHDDENPAVACQACVARGFLIEEYRLMQAYAFAYLTERG